MKNSRVWSLHGLTYGGTDPDNRHCDNGHQAQHYQIFARRNTRHVTVFSTGIDEDISLDHYQNMYV